MTRQIKKEVSMKTKIFLLLLFTITALALGVTSARADGIIIPDPPICDGGLCPPLPCPGGIELCPPISSALAIRYHHVTVTIQDQVAVTHVDQVFYNPNSWQVEGTYIFPIPQDAAVTAFTLWVDGKPVEATILDAAQARQKYEEITRNLKDPALLEYAGRGAVQARIFPIPPGGERRVELEYTQALVSDNGLVRYIYPLNTEKFSALPLEDVAISLEINSSVPIRLVYSPSHKISIDRLSPNQVRVGYEDSTVKPDADFAVYYSLGEEQAFHLLTYRDPFDPSDPDGFFLALLAPRPDAAADQALAKDVILVLDRSGSMEGEKFQQAQEATRYILGHLNPEDRFGVIAFSTGLETFAPDLRTAAEIQPALDWVDRLGAQGSTDINRALLEAAAIADSERPTYLIFLTDGLPTEGVVDSAMILDNFRENAPQDLRLFAFGVGYDVDTFLLDSIAQEHHGASTYVLPEERLDETLSAFYAKISTPVLTDLRLDFGGMPVYDLYPSPLPDLFAGSQTVLVGRYRQGGRTDVTLKGEVNGQVQTFRFPDQIFAERSEPSEAQPAIDRLWATRKIGYLLSQIRLNGPQQETIDQIVRLSIRYGIVTPYTSYLVTEELPLGAAEQSRIAGEQYNQMLATPPSPATGQEAVQKAADQGALSAAEAPAAVEASTGQTVRIIGSKTFVYSDGAWVDTAFDPDKTETVQVAFLSDDYFKLIQASPELGSAFALGGHVIAVSSGTAYEVVDEGASLPPLDLPATPTPEMSVQDKPVPTIGPVQSTASVEQPVAPGALRCANGLAPLAFTPLLAVALLRRRRGR
jgi:Ca-activated chloride channel family protein